ncbi:hypothetical protein H4219_006188 [Mycoemilia scoparia]|uniref:Uncharacterized protein n=1 Tax=Mycoemilia scoparia TaxID=417184 RepID=A0A9W7ZQ20_9FUNG|nr:hypothetical protein H4219_006188 [Mycoemilia scoparia]
MSAVDHTNLMAQNRALSSHFEHEPGLFDQTIEQGFDSDYTVFDSLIVQDIRTPQGVVKSWIVDENTNSQGTSIDATTRRGRSGGGQPTAFEILTRPEFEYIGVGNSLTFSTLLFASGEPKSKHHQGSTSSNSVDNVARFSAYKKFYVENCERYDGLGDYDAKSISDACVAEMLTFTNNSNTGSSEPGNDNNNDSDDLNDNDNDSDSDDSNDYDDNDSKNKSHS